MLTKEKVDERPWGSSYPGCWGTSCITYTTQRQEPPTLGANYRSLPYSAMDQISIPLSEDSADT